MMRVAILGAGTMGTGIAQVTAKTHEVVIRDIEQDVIDSGMKRLRDDIQTGVEKGKVTEEEQDKILDQISSTTSLAKAVQDADFVIEAVPEDLELKKDVFEDVETHAPSDAILATNTSSLSITAIASALERPYRAIGLHFFNPAHIMPLVEIVLAEQTNDATREAAELYIDDIEKESVVVQDSPGFASSRLGVSLGVEAMRMLQEGVATAPDIDKAMRLGYNHPMGPLELTDVVGLDVRLDVLEHLREEVGERFRPPMILRRKVRAGDLGKKTGAGFYEWDDGEIIEAVDTNEVH